MTADQFTSKWAVVAESAAAATHQYFDPLRQQKRAVYSAAVVLFAALWGLLWVNVQGLLQNHQASVAELRKASEALMLEGNRLKDENLELRVGRLRENDDISLLKRTLDELSVEMEKLLKEKTTLEHALTELESRRDGLAYQLRESYQTQATLEATRDALQQGNEVLMAELDALRESNRTLFAVNEDLKEDNTRLARAATTLGLQLPVMAVNIPKLPLLSSSASQRMTSMQESVSAHHIEQLRRSEPSREVSAAEVLREVRSRARELRNTQVEIRVLETRRAELSASNGRTELEVDKLKRENRELEFKIEPIERSHKNLLNEANHMREQQRDLVESVASANAQNRKLRDLIRRASQR